MLGFFWPGSRIPPKATRGASASARSRTHVPACQLLTRQRCTNYSGFGPIWQPQSQYSPGVFDGAFQQRSGGPHLNIVAESEPSRDPAEHGSQGRPRGGEIDELWVANGTVTAAPAKPSA